MGPQAAINAVYSPIINTVEAPLQIGHQAAAALLGLLLQRLLQHLPVARDDQCSRSGSDHGDGVEASTQEDEDSRAHEARNGQQGEPGVLLQPGEHHTSLFDQPAAFLQRRL